MPVDRYCRKDGDLRAKGKYGLWDSGIADPTVKEVHFINGSYRATPITNPSDRLG